jgi:hypothetical protein
MRWILTGVIGAAGCQEYGLGTKPDPDPMPIDSAVPQTTPEPEPTPPEPEPSCATFVAPTLVWVGSTPFTDPLDPVDAAGLPFWDPAADTTAWPAVTLPDRDVPIGTDRAYVGTFELAELPPNLSVSLQSDDGIWLWVNGAEIGHWGGAWQQEGCVNENANCLVTTSVPDVDVTPHLQLGTNRFAARVSNPVFDAWFEVIVTCVDTPTP